ncbi:MAG: YsnF/AvaK domain-containing protein [Gemmatimonadota bacterium]|nr:YsnF/AvaK domain-containing protein [Gemmatimonadota bacterium]
MASNDKGMTDKARDMARAGKDNVENTASGANDSSVTGGKIGREVGEGVGGVGGIVAGAAIGSVVGPIGTVVGAIAGAMGGWWAGKEVVSAVEGYSSADAANKKHFETQPRNAQGTLKSYDQARPAYQLGYVASQNPDYKGKSFDKIEPDVKRGWTKDMEQQYRGWSDVRMYAQEGYERGGKQPGMGMQEEQTMTRSEEELVVGKRQVKAGEVDLKKTVDTEHVTKSVPLMHEEIEVERHSVAGDSARGEAEIAEQHIRVPLSAEEAVVSKRVVAKEEIVIKKHAVDETKTVEADIRKERIDIDKQGRGKDVKETRMDEDTPSSSR